MWSSSLLDPRSDDLIDTIDEVEAAKLGRLLRDPIVFKVRGAQPRHFLSWIVFGIQIRVNLINDYSIYN